MTAWESIVADQIDARHRQASAEWGLGFDLCEDTPNLNAAFLDCRTAFSPPLFALRHVPHPKGDEVEDWRSWMRDRYREKMASGYYADRRNALADAWSEAERAYHFLKGSVPHTRCCAGCGNDLYGSDPVMNHLDGAKTHLNATCPDRYDATWRAEAKAGLVGMGLRRPD